MSTDLALIEPALSSDLSPAQAVLVDHIGNEVYAAHYTERRVSRFIIDTEAVLLVFAGLLIYSLAHRPVANRYAASTRWDGRRRSNTATSATARVKAKCERTSPSGPTTGTRSTARPSRRGTRSTTSSCRNRSLRSEMAEDTQDHFIPQVLSGQAEQSDAQVQNVTITGMSEETVAGVRLAKGTALVNLDKLYSVRNSHEPRTEHWLLSVTYYLNPKQVSEQSRVFPQFETINPLGLTITEFHENRVSVTPIEIGASPSTIASNKEGGR